MSLTWLELFLCVCLCQGATDFIFGQRGQAYFGGNTIGVKGAGWVTASGRSSDDSTSCEFPNGHFF